MPRTLTPSQSKALSQERHLALTANAGSGKTHVLVTKYLDLLERDPLLHPRSIVAITFSENAASELSEKIAQGINERLLAGSEDQRTLMREVLEGFSSAMVTTIHGFATRVLKGYPVEASIDAAFGILQGADQQLVRDDSMSRVFYSVLEEAYAQQTESEILRAFRALGRRGMTNTIRALLNNRMRADTVRDILLSRPDEEILEEWYQAALDELSLPDRELLRGHLHALLGHFKTGAIGKKGEQATLDFLANDPRSYLEAIHTLLASMSTKAGTIPAHTFEKSAPADICEQLNGIFASLTAQRPLLGLLVDGKEAFVVGHREYLRIVRAAYDLYAMVVEDYEVVKNELAQLDFDDLLMRLKRLLENSHVRQELAKQYPHVMIDEYQDTDDTQFEIARLLSLNFGPTTRMTIVGDPKQSIYRFRNADVTVFQATSEAISRQSLSEAAVSEARSLCLDLDESRGLLSLRESFRMARTPLAFINTLFRQAMARGSDNAYLDLVEAYQGNGLGSVTLAVAPKARRSSQDEDELESDGSEAEYLARKLRSIVGQLEIDGNDGRRSATYDDCAILLRTRTRLPELEAALREHDVPFTVLKGTGFFEQQEVIDVISYLRFLVTPSEDTALVAVLRSPFFCVSDQELYQISHSYRASAGQDVPHFWARVLAYPTDHRSPELCRAIEEFEALFPLVGRTSSAFLVERLYALSGIIASVGSTPGGAQKRLNLEKLLQLAREADHSGFSSLFDFVERLNYLMEHDDSEAQADAVTDGQSVRIMTVHAAKGLEFPVVAVPFLSHPPRSERGCYLDKHLGLRLPFVKEEATVVTTVLDSRADRAAAAEALRLLYVALTRAQEHLILTATDEPGKATWFGSILAAIPELGMPLDTTIETEIERYNGVTGITEVLPFALTIHRDPIDQVWPESEGTSVTTLEDIEVFQLDELKIVHPSGSYSATQFLTMRECPTKYHLRYALGLAEEPKLARDLEPHQAAERISGTMIGQLVHKLLEQFESFSTGDNLDDEQFAAIADVAIQDLLVHSKPERQALLDEAYVHVQNFLRSNLATFVRASQVRKSEFELQYRLDTGNRIFGILDRVLKLPDGRLSVVDFKTDHLTESNRQTKLARYRYQLLFYAYLLSKYSGQDAVVGSLFFTRTSEHYSYDFTSEDFASLESQFAELIATALTNENVRRLSELVRNEEHCGDCAYFSRSNNACIANSVEDTVSSETRPQKPIAIPAM